VGVVGEQYGRLIVTEVRDEELAIGALKRAGLLFEEARVTIFAMWDIEFDGAPSRSRQVCDFAEQFGRAPAQGDEGDTFFIKPVEPRVGGELGIEDEVRGRLAMLALPEIDEAEDLVGLLALANIGVRVAKTWASGSWARNTRMLG